MEQAFGTGALCLTLAWERGSPLRATSIENRLSGRIRVITSSVELAVVLSAEPGRLSAPDRFDDFIVTAEPSLEASGAVFSLRSARSGLEAEVYYRLDGTIRRKWAVLKNTAAHDILVLDIILDRLSMDAVVQGGGQGQPVFAGNDLFAVMEHPSGWNEAEGSAFALFHCPGRRLAPGASMESRPALIGAAPQGQALAAFVQWIQQHSVRLRKKTVSVYTPFGINNQWGLAGTLDDEQTLHVLDTLKGWRKKGTGFDYFTLDTGWVDYGSDLKRFRPVGFPEGPAAVIDKVRAVGMQFGLWFATSWASQSCWDYPPAWGGRDLPPLTWRNGHAAMTDYAASFCLAAPPYFALLKEAVLHHVRENGVRFLKFDGGNYACSDESHGHLPGRYAVEAMHEMLIELAAAARAAAPDVFIMWYWGLRSPFWALHGDTIFESGLFMEGSGTSSFPAFSYRDSVTLAQDQNACHAATIPPVAKDSLGVWLADTRWGNFMGRDRWREALVMDLGRGNLLFPNLWGDIYLLDDNDVRFLGEMSDLARRNEDLLLAPRRQVGDPMANEPYGYAYFGDHRGLVFLNNVHFTARAVSIPLPTGAKVDVSSLFPEKARLARCAAESLRVLLRPFETLMLEIRPASALRRPAPQRLPDTEAARLGVPLALRARALDPDMEVRFADEARFTTLGHRQEAQSFDLDLPPLDGPEQPFLCVAVTLRKGGADWKYSPVVAEIVQATARTGDERVHFIPVPDARQFGNTQKAGCSWVVYRTRLPRRWSARALRLAVHSFVPDGVQARVEAWVVRRWWSESARPIGDGYYADAPS